MNSYMETQEKRSRLSEVALGLLPADKVFLNSTIFNVFTREFIKNQSVWIKDGMIAYVGSENDPPRDNQTEVIDVEEMVLLPGLIEGHTHITNRYSIEEFVKQVIPTGVTTVITETMEFGLVAGKDGIEYFIKGLEGQPLRFYFTLSPLCGLTSSQEKMAPTNEELLPLLQNPNCLGIGEVYWGNIFLEGRQGERVRELVSTALQMGKLVEGHTAGASGRKLQAYTDFGFSSCHEPVTDEEVLERLRMGYWVMIREGGVRKELKGVKKIFKKRIDHRRLSLCTDGMDAEGFVKEGYLNASLRRMLKFKVPPGLAYQMVTLNVAEHFHLDHLIGSIAPGKMADMVVIPSPEDYSPKMILCDGRMIFKEGKTLVEPKKVFFPDSMFHTVKVEGDILASLPNRGKVRVMELVTRLVTRERIIDLEHPVESRDLILLLALDRTGSGKTFMGLLKGFGLKRGAYGSTMCWDTPDMIVVGCDAHSIKTVIERLKENGGGGVYAIGEKVISEFQAPLCGMVSLKPMETVRDEIKRLEETLRKNGVKWEKPVLTIDTLGTPAIPQLRITHKGYVKLKDREILPLEV